MTATAAATEPALTPAELGRIVRAVDPAAFVVPARIVRRAIKHDRGLPSLRLGVPHRKVFVMPGASALAVVDRGELGLRPDEEVPPTLILIAEPEPDEDEDEARSRGEVLRECWRRLFHARVHVELDQRIAEGSIDAVGVRERIRRLGPSNFEEARSVLRQQEAVLPPGDDASLFVEFAAVYLELRAFAQDLLPAYFPSIVDHESAARLLIEDVDADALLASTRPPGSIDAQGVPPLSATEPTPAGEAEFEHEFPSSSRHRRWLEAAELASERGNLVRASILRTRAARLAGSSSAGQARSLARKALDQLAARLKAALEFDDADLREWRAALPALLERSSRGFWTPEARLLYDLQKVCVDHERAIYKVDLVEWALTLGRRPVKRLLPNHQKVLIVQHLRGVGKKLTVARLAEADRARLTALIEQATHRAEGRLRDRLRPEIGEALEETGFAPRNLAERVALQKLVEEMLDRVVDHGFLAMGDLRDAISRNNRKLPDLAGPIEFLRGDRLLRLDGRLAIRLDGVYRRGEVYLRALQRLSSLAFGTRTGRALTRYLVLPYGGTAMILEGLQHVIGPIAHAVAGVHVEVLNWSTFGAGGTLALLLIASRDFRSAFGRWLRRTYGLGRDVVVGLPTWIFRRSIVRKVLGSRSFAILCRAVLLPAILTGAAWLARPSAMPRDQAWPASALIFAVTSLLLTTRAGRNLEELAVEAVGRAWTALVSNLLPGLFRLIIDTFDRVLEAVEQVLYTVDEWFRFRSGQARSMLGVKAVFGVAWFLIAYIVRFLVTLLVEPQINPIKHFPVVTVSHKIMATQAKLLVDLLSKLLEHEEALAMTGFILLVTPGFFGFLVWELKENWRLYEANRPRSLQPTVIGHHGETMARLLKPGFHSGTVPKLFAKLRQAERKAIQTGHARGVRKHLVHLDAVEESVRHFLDRDFLSLLQQGRSTASTRLVLGEVTIGVKRFAVEFRRADREGEGPGFVLTIEEHSGWIVAGLADHGLLDGLTPSGRSAMATALAGLYKMARVDLVRDSIAHALGPDHPDFDFREEGIVVWPRPDSPAEVLYLLRPTPGVPPLVSISATGEPALDHVPKLDTERLLFTGVEISWRRWVEAWEDDLAGFDHPSEVVGGFPILPGAEPSPGRGDI